VHLRSLLLTLFTILLLTDCKKPARNGPVIQQPDQPLEGYGGRSYKFGGVVKRNFDDNTNLGFWLYYPADTALKEAPVVVFNHGYGLWNPACYGGWIKHLVRRGNIVIFPRYQATLMTSPSTYTSNVAAAINRAFKEIASQPTWPQPIKSKLVYVGHSFGGVISANLALSPGTYSVPAPKAIILACPGTGNTSQGAASSYKMMSSKLKMLLITEADDNSNGTTFPDLLYNTTTYIPAANKNHITHVADKHGYPAITADHGEAAATDMTFDSGQRNTFINLSFSGTRIDATDYFCYWKLTDALMDCIFNKQGCETALGNTEAQKNMGKWSDGTQVKQLQVK